MSQVQGDDIRETIRRTGDLHMERKEALMIRIYKLYTRIGDGQPVLKCKEGSVNIDNYPNVLMCIKHAQNWKEHR